jgi:decaprenyl-phosphate phosphoribosyltransferase
LDERFAVDYALNIESSVTPDRSPPAKAQLAAVAVVEAPPDPGRPPTHLGRVLDLLGGLLLLLRPRQWIKSGLVLLAPLLTAPAAMLAHGASLALTVLAFITAASVVYVFNDIRDRDRDRLHPVKRLRPLASGRVGFPAAVCLLVVTGLALLFLMVLLPPPVDLVIGVYLVTNLWYCLSLKHQPLVDVCVVASGFVLRTMAGSLAVGVEPRPSLLICVYCACLALSLGKRRHELAGLQGNGEALRHRPALRAYSVQFLDQIIILNLVATLVGYVTFVWLDVPPHGAFTAAITFPFAVFALCRYLQMITVQSSGGDPVADLIRDRATMVNGLLWTVALVAGVML